MFGREYELLKCSMDMCFNCAKAAAVYSVCQISVLIEIMMPSVTIGYSASFVMFSNALSAAIRSALQQAASGHSSREKYPNDANLRLRLKWSTGRTGLGDRVSGPS